MKRHPFFFVGSGPSPPDSFTYRGVRALERSRSLVVDASLFGFLPHLDHDPRMRFVDPATELAESVLADLAEELEEGSVARIFWGSGYLEPRPRVEAARLASLGAPVEWCPGADLLWSTARAARAVPQDLTWAFLALGSAGAAPSVPAPGSGGLSLALWRPGPGWVGAFRSTGWDDSTKVAIVTRSGPSRETEAVTLGELEGRAAEGEDTVWLVGGQGPNRGEASLPAGPLAGKRVIVTRPIQLARSLSEPLREAGAEVMEVPAIRTEPVNSTLLDRALARLDRYSWLVFTSATAVDVFFRRLGEIGDIRSLGEVRIAVIGPSTRRAVERYLVRVDLQPASFDAESLFEALKRRQMLAGVRFLLPRSQIARPFLPDALARMGAHVDEIVIYQTVYGPDPPPAVQERLARDGFDYLILTSPSGAEGFLEFLRRHALEPLLEKARIVSIGPITSAKIRELGLTVHIEAEEHSVLGLVMSLLQ